MSDGYYHDVLFIPSQHLNVSKSMVKTSKGFTVDTERTLGIDLILRSSHFNTNTTLIPFLSRMDRTSAWNLVRTSDPPQTYGRPVPLDYDRNTK